MSAQTYHQPTEIAKILGVSAFTVRRWCEWHGEHLSAGANPVSGRPRRLDGRDLEVLRHVAKLRGQGLQTAEINEQLRNVSFAVVEPENSLQAAQEGQGSVLPPVPAQSQPESILAALVARLDAIERQQSDSKQQQRDWFYGIALGVLIGVAAMGGIVVLFALLGRGG